MKRKTMAIFAVAAFVILSVALIQAVDTDANPGDNEAEAKYIIGQKDAQGNESGKEMGNGLEATISFNRTAFTTNATVTFEVKNNGTYQAVTFASEQATESNAVQTGLGTEVKIVRTDAATGVYTVKFSKQADASITTGTTYIKMTVTERMDQTALPQEFYYAAHIVNPKLQFAISSHDGDSYTYRGEGPTATKMSLEFDQYVSKEIWIEDAGVSPSQSVGGYVFYGTGLPEGLSVTIDGRIGGKLSSGIDVDDDIRTMEIHAVRDGVDRTLSIPWTVGVKGADFSLTVGNQEKEFVMVKVNESITGIKVKENGAGTIKKDENDKYEITVKTKAVTPQDVSDGGDHSEWELPGFSGTGTYIVTVAAEMTFNGKTTTVEKTLTVYVVGGIYDGNLKPVVKTA